MAGADHHSIAVDHQQRQAVSCQDRKSQPAFCRDQPVSAGKLRPVGRCAACGDDGIGAMDLPHGGKAVRAQAHGTCRTVTVLRDKCWIIIRSEAAIQTVIHAAADPAGTAEKAMPDPFGSCLMNKMRDLTRHDKAGHQEPSVSKPGGWPVPAGTRSATLKTSPI